MIRPVLLTIFAAGGMTLAGCMPTPAGLASTPVVIETPEGQVTCQFYLDDVVLWDNAIAQPEGMGEATADAYCVREGERRRDSLLPKSTSSPITLAPTSSGP
jgi:hypothetical protein